MSLIKRFVTRHIHAAAAQRPQGQESAAVFFYGPPPSVETMAAWAGDIAATATVRQEERKTRLTLEWPDASLLITLDPDWDKTAQMTGLSKWAERFPARVRALPKVVALLASFAQVTACFGMVCKPGFAANTALSDLLLRLPGSESGFFFSGNSFYAADRSQITGLDDDPLWLGRPTSEM